MLNWRIQSWSARALTLAFSLLLYINLTAQDVVPTKGTEFWVGFMDNFDSSESLDLFITSNEATSGSVSIPQMDWSFDFDVNANETTTVTVPSNLAVHADENQIISNRGVLVETEDTVSVFAINFRQFTSDGTKILPTRALGTDYRVTSYTGLTGAGSELLVVATEDNTEIEIIPSVITGGGNPAGVPFTVQLNRGQSYQIFQNESSYDLTGTIVRATESSGLCRPFAVFSGVSCANIPVGCTYCDHICEQNFPTTAWGMEYYLVPYAFATGVTYRVLAQENGTEIYVNGSLVSTLDAGQFYENNHVNSPTCIQSSLPVSVVQFMQGTSCSSLGDPAMLFLNDATQKIDNVTFSTVISNQITNHGVNLVMATEDIATLTLDGEQVDINEFSQFPSCPENSYAQLSISPGSHTLDAPNGFTAYSFGLGNAESYSYSVGSFSPNPFNIELEEVYCTDEQVVLTLDEPSFDAFWYHFDFPEDTLSFESSLVLDVPVVNGVYVVEFNSSVSGCEQVQYYSVESPEPPAVNVNPENVTICQYENTQLSLNPSPPNSFYNYSWTPELGLSNSTISNPVASPLTSTTYTYTVTSPTGCSSASGEVDVTVEGGDYSNLKIYSTENDICIGQSVDLYALIEEIRFYDDFDLGIQSSLWSEIANGNLGNACGSVSGEGLYFNNSGLRSATTIPIDVALGGTINFALHYGESTFPCDQVDAGEDVILEYSIDGIYWHEVQVLYNFLQSGWEQYSFEVPILAQTSNTQFRWRQLANTGTNQDNWTLDNVAISATITENSELNWFHNDELIDSNTSMITVFPEQDEQYFVEFEDLDAGCVYSDSIWIAASHAFELEISPDTAICNLEEVQLSVLASSPDAYEYLWTPSDGSISTETSSSPIVSPISSITYYVQVTSNQGCVNHADVTVSVSPPLELSINSSATEICQGDMLELSADLAENPDHLSYTWEATPLIEIPAQSDVTLNPNQSTNLTVLVTDTLTECSVNESFFIEVYGDFTVNAGADTLLCNAENFNLNATASNQGTYTWSWMPSAEVLDYQSASTSVLSNVSNEFIITADENGCFQRDTILVTSVFEDLNLGPDLEICDGDSLTLSSGYPNASHSWSTGENLESIIVSEENLYSVTLTSEIGCSISDELEVLVLESPNVNLGPDLNLCQGENVDLNADNTGSSYSWNTGDSSQLINVDSSGIYAVEVVNQNNCVGEDQVVITVFDNPVPSLPEDTTICEDEFLVLNAGNLGATYLWLPGLEETQSIEVNTSNNYQVIITGEGNCSILDEITLEVLNYPELELGDDISVCGEESVILDTEADSYQNVAWSSGEQTNAIEINFGGVYSVIVDNGYCFSHDSIEVLYYPLPTIDFPSKIESCFKDKIVPETLEAHYENATYLWNDGSVLPSLDIYNPGSYSVEVTSEFGCHTTFFMEAIEFCFGSELFAPNTFTPGADGLNDGWKAEGPYVLDFHLQIYNRWGKIVFESFDISEPWLGNNNHGEYYTQDDVYTYRIRYRYLNQYGNTSEWVAKTGHINVLR